MPFRKERLRELMQEMGIKSQLELARRIGVSQGLVSQWLDDAKVKVPGQKMLEALARELRTSADYLYGLSDQREVSRLPRPTSDVPLGITVQLPVYGPVNAGAPLLLQDNVIGWEPARADDIRGGDFFYLRVQGDSMVAAHIPNNALVLVRRQEMVESGDIAVVEVRHDEATVKRVRFSGDQVLLCPANPQYLPTIHPRREIRIIGKVKKVILDLERLV